jgi:GAF domain-containing protein
MDDAVNTRNLRTFDLVAEALVSSRNLLEAFATIVRVGVETVGGAEHAGVTILKRGQFETPAASGELPRQVDKIQYSLGSGPCIDALLDNTVYRSGNLAADTRWPEFGRRAVEEAGVISMMAFRLFLEDEESLAVLNFYSTQPDAFDDESARVGEVFATHAGIAITAATRQERIDHLETALQSNREIGMAIGILMARELLTQEQAFDLLRMSSQHTHRKLRDIANDVIETGSLVRN